MSDERAPLEKKLTDHYARMEILRFVGRDQRDIYDRAVADYDREWMVGENLRTQLRTLANGRPPR